MRLILLVLLLLIAAAHGRFLNRMKRELAASGGTSKYPFAIQLKNGTTVYPYAMQLKDIDIKRNRGVNGTTVYPFAIQLKDIDIKGIRGESHVSEEKSEAKNILENGFIERTLDFSCGGESEEAPEEVARAQKCQQTIR